MSLFNKKSEFLTMPRQHSIFGRRDSKLKLKLTITSRWISFFPSSNNKPSSTPYRVGSKIKVVSEEKYNEELSVGISYYSYYSTLVIDDDLNMGDMSGGNCSINNHTHSQQYYDSNNGDMSSGYGF